MWTLRAKRQRKHERLRRAEFIRRGFFSGNNFVKTHNGSIMVFAIPLPRTNGNRAKSGRSADR